MMLPPFFAIIQVAGEGKRGLRLWLPVFLLWPLLAVALVVAPLAMIPLAVQGRVKAKTVLLAGPSLLAVLGSARGLRMDVQDGKSSVCVRVF